MVLSQTCLRTTCGHELGVVRQLKLPGLNKLGW